jgi:sensor histidine kinase regulating citrate/malate metabolism
VSDGDGSGALTTRKRKAAPSGVGADPARFPVVGIGASAGGLAAIEEFLSALPADRAFFVKDDGVGFDLEQATHLFGAFQRMHSPEEFEGVGIGLATVHRLVRRHGGRCWAEAEVENGATIYFTLPGRAQGDKEPAGA